MPPCDSVILVEVDTLASVKAGVDNVVKVAAIRIVRVGGLSQTH